MTRRTLAGLTGLVAALALLLTGCASVPKDDQLEAWNAAVLARVPNAVGAQAHASRAGFTTEITMDVTLRNDVYLTYDDLRATYDAIVSSTTEEWYGENMAVQVTYADTPDRELWLFVPFEDAGVDADCHENTTREWPEWSVCADSYRPGVMILSLDAAKGNGFPPATQTPPDAGPRATAEQIEAWTDAIQASDSDVESAEIRAVGRTDDEEHFLSVNVILTRNEELTYDCMKNVYEAMMTATEETWRGERAILYFASQGETPEQRPWDLHPKDAFDAAGITDANTATVTSSEFDLEIILDPTGLDFPEAPTEGSE
jgi:hypothetical protein